MTDASATPHRAVPGEIVPDEVRGVLIQIAQARLLLPNATISEVLSYADPEPVGGAPDWLLGRILWRGWSLPLIAFSRMAGLAAVERGGLGSKVAVMKNLRVGDRLPYIALLTQGFPRVVNVSPQTLEADGGDEALPPAVSARVRIQNDVALVPDLEVVAARVDEALRA